MSESFMEQFCNLVSVLAGPEDMRRTRQFNGQPHTDLGERGALVLNGINLRDIKDCYIRAFIAAHPTIDENGKDIEPNATLYKEALKGQHAMLNSNALFKLVGEPDPLAVCQNLNCEIEKLMGVFPNLPGADSEHSTLFKRVRQNVYLSESGKEVRLYELPHLPIKAMNGDAIFHWGLYINNELSISYPDKHSFVTKHNFTFIEE